MTTFGGTEKQWHTLFYFITMSVVQSRGTTEDKQRFVFSSIPLCWLNTEPVCQQTHELLEKQQIRLSAIFPNTVLANPQPAD